MQKALDMTKASYEAGMGKHFREAQSGALKVAADLMRTNNNILAQAVVNPYYDQTCVVDVTDVTLAQSLPPVIQTFLPDTTKDALVGSSLRTLRTL